MLMTFFALALAPLPLHSICKIFRHMVIDETQLLVIAMVDL